MFAWLHIGRFFPRRFYSLDDRTDDIEEEKVTDEFTWVGEKCSSLKVLAVDGEEQRSGVKNKRYAAADGT